MCSTCNVTFQTAQQFYEHLDECVLSKVIAPEPAGDINASNLDQVDVEEIQATLSVHGLLDDYDESEASEEDCDDENDKLFKSTRARSNKKQR